MIFYGIYTAHHIFTDVLRQLFTKIMLTFLHLTFFNNGKKASQDVTGYDIPYMG